MQKPLLIRLSLFLSILVTPNLSGQKTDCTQDSRALRAKNAMSGSEDGIMCGNLAQFYAYLCECENNPRTPEQAKMLRATLMQIKSTYENYGSPCNGIRTLPTPGPCKVGAAGAARGRGAQSEAQKIQQSINNFRRAKGMIERARNRAKQAAAELDSRVRINANGSPGTIMGDFNQSMQAIKGIDARLREDITVGYINDAASVVQDYSAGNMEGAGYGVLGVLGSIAENEEAKERVKEKRNQLIREKNRALRNAANKMIDINNAALEKWLDLASSALEEDREMYFMNKAFFHSCFARSVANNFNTANTAWARPNCSDVAEPNYKRYYNPLHEQYYEAALRKKKLFDQYENEVLYRGSLEHIATAIKMEPSRVEYFIAQGRIANPKDLVLSLSSYGSAYKIDPGYFNDELLKEMQSVQDLANQELMTAINSENLDIIRDYIDARLMGVMDLNGLDALSYAAYRDKSKAIDLIVERYINRQLNKKEARDLYLAALAQASSANNPASLALLSAKPGLGVDVRYERTELIAYAAENLAEESFYYIYENSQERNKIEQRYRKDLIYVMALAKNRPQEATQALLAFPKMEKLSGINELIFQSPQKPHFLHLLLNSSDLKKSLREDPATQANLQRLTLNGLYGNDLVTASTGSYNSELWQQEAIQNLTETWQAAGLSEEDIQAALAQMGTGSNTNNTAPSQGVDVARILNEEVLDPQFLAENKANFTDYVLNADDVALFQSLKSKSLLSAQNNEGLPLAYSFIGKGSRILQSGAASHLDFNKKIKEGEGILHNLAFTASPNESYLLKQAGIDINQRGPYDWTPLHYAARQNRLDLAKALILAGADPDLKDEWGRKPKDIAKEYEFEEMLAFLKRL